MMSAVLLIVMFSMIDFRSENGNEQNEYIDDPTNDYSR